MQKTFEYQGIKINFIQEGPDKGPTVVLVHGLGASTLIWEPVAQRLKNDFKVIRVDLKGFGDSDKPDDDKYSLQDQAEILTDLIEKKFGQVFLAGHSFGGAVVLRTLYHLRKTDQENLVNGLVVVNGLAYLQKIPWIVRLLQRSVVGEFVARRKFFKKLSEKIILTGFKKKDAANQKVAEILASNYDNELAKKALVSTLRQIIPADHKEMVAFYKTIDIPVLLAWGIEDKVIPLELGERLQKDIPGAELVELDCANHNCLVEKPDSLAGEMKNFFEKLAKRGFKN